MVVYSWTADTRMGFKELCPSLAVVTSNIRLITLRRIACVARRNELETSK